jgi:DNA-binding winged helix-turn-helix (wHTH) protein
MTEPTEAAARVPALGVFRLGEWSVRQSEGVVSSKDRSVRLEPRVMDVLVCLAADSGRVVAKEELLARVWGGAFVEEGALSQAIHSLRKILGDDARQPHYVQTIPKRGYRLLVPVELEHGPPEALEEASLNPMPQSPADSGSTPLPMIANFRAELAAFAELLLPECGKRILFFYGESGIGKTTLLRHCLELLPETFYLVEFQVRNAIVDEAEILSRVVSCLGWRAFPRYKAQIEALHGHKIELKNLSIAGNNDQLSAIIRSEVPVQPYERKGRLLDAWFDDLANFSSPILIVFDTYEHASTEIQNWIEGPFLYRIARIRSVRVMIAGRVVPEAKTIEWGRWCSAYHLKGILDAKHWLPVVRSLNRHIPKPELTWLDGLCRGLRGSPHAIMQFIESLPQDEGPQ